MCVRETVRGLATSVEWSVAKWDKVITSPAIVISPMSAHALVNTGTWPQWASPNREREGRASEQTSEAGGPPVDIPQTQTGQRGLGKQHQPCTNMSPHVTGIVITPRPSNSPQPHGRWMKQEVIQRECPLAWQMGNSRELMAGLGYTELHTQCMLSVPLSQLQLMRSYWFLRRQAFLTSRMEDKQWKALKKCQFLFNHEFI